MQQNNSYLRHSGKILHANSALNQLLHKARYIAALEKILLEHLDQNLRPHCCIGSYENGRLVVVLSGGHWATRLRYQQQELAELLALRPEFSELQQLVFKVRPTNSQPPTEDKPRLSISATAGDTIFQCAQAIEDDVLRQALLRLASNADPA